MPRPRRYRRILKDPQTRCFNPENEEIDVSNPIEIKIDEFEAIRLRDYLDIQQKKSAELMGISQPTFHRILTSARKKISEALIDGKKIAIVGEDYFTSKNRYICNDCGFEWIKHDKTYEKCPDCQSKHIKIELGRDSIDDDLINRRSYGGQGLGAGPPRICKCPECGFEYPKTKAVPCKNTKCPKCEIPLCGAD
jgi:uncharacterized protein